MLNMMRKIGLSSKVMYTMGFGSIGVSFASWLMSKNAEPAGLDRADRWGIFTGLWAPTCFTIGTALRLEEQWGKNSNNRDSFHQFDEMREGSRDPLSVG